MVTFKDCGLDIRQNMLEAPICECGCGEYAALVLNAEQDLYDFIGTMLEEYECNHCAIFTVCLNDNAVVGIKLPDGIKIYKGTAHEDGSILDMIANMQREFDCHCYGLLEQIDVDLYSIVME